MLKRDNDRAVQSIASVKSLAPLIAANRDAFDRDRRIPDKVFKALADANLFRLWLPAELGGPQCSPLDFMDIVETAAALDGSVGWLIGNGAGMSRAAGYLDASVAQEWFSDPYAFIVGATGAVGAAVACPGGYRVNGRWPFGSGSHHATRFMGVCNVSDQNGGQPLSICCYFSRDEVTIDDNWNVSGLRGTGSCDFEVRNVFVPSEHTHPLFNPVPTSQGSIYRLPAMSAFPWTVSVVPLGIARGMIDAFIALTTTKTRAGVAQRDRETVQLSLGRASALHGAGRAYLVSTMTELLNSLDGNIDQLINARIAFRLACTNAGEAALRIAEIVASEAGAASIFQSGTIERSIRDIQAATKHIAMNANSYVFAGRHALGLDPGPRF
jgi:alkylation response protein AidB-like acyl-CoA dehydrogenase